MNYKSCLSLLLIFAVCSQSAYVDLTKWIKIGSQYATVCYTSSCTYKIPSTTPSKVTDTIQNALDAVETAGGGVVHLKEGTYQVDKNILVGSKTHFKGDGIDKTVIKLKNFAAPFIIGSSSKSGLIRSRAKNNQIISDMTVNGNKANQYTDEDHEYGRYGLFTEGCTDVLFNKVKVINFQGYGFDPHGWKSQGIWGKNLTITNCIAQDNNWDGFTLDQTFYMNVLNNSAIHNGRHGFNIVTGTKFAYMSGNTAFNNGYFYYSGSKGCGIMIQNNQDLDTSDVEVINNYITRNNKAGICTNDVYNIVIKGNTVDKSCNCNYFTATRGTTVLNNICSTKLFYSTVGSVVVVDNAGTYTGPMDTVVYLKGNTHTPIVCTPFMQPESVSTLAPVLFSVKVPDTPEVQELEPSSASSNHKLSCYNPVRALLTVLKLFI